MKTIGIVGCGKIALAHAATIAKRSDHVLACCDRNVEKAQKLAAKYGSTKVFTDVNDMFAMEKLSALHILTRVDSHVEIAHNALAHGAHIYVEKPVVETRAEFESLRSAAHESGLVFYPGYSALGSPAFQRASKLLRSGVWGNLISVHCDYNWTPGGGGIPYGSGDHWAYALRGGILQNLADHPASLVVHLLDDVVASSASRVRRTELPRDVHDVLHVVCEGSRQVGSFTVSFGHGNSRGLLACHLERATIEVDLRTHFTTVIPLDGPASLGRRVISGLRTSVSIGSGVLSFAARRAAGRLPRQPGVAATVMNFHDVIDGTAASFVDAEKGATITGVLDEVWRSGGS